MVVLPWGGVTVNDNIGDAGEDCIVVVVGGDCESGSGVGGSGGVGYSSGGWVLCSGSGNDNDDVNDGHLAERLVTNMVFTIFYLGGHVLFSLM